MTRLRLLPAGLALALAAWLLPGSAAPTHAAGITAALQQDTSQKEPGAQPVPERQQQSRQLEHQEDAQQEAPQARQPEPSAAKMQIILTGKVYASRGRYMFRSNETRTTFRVSNPSMVKRYSGQTVKVVASVNPQAHSIHVSKIQPASS